MTEKKNRKKNHVHNFFNITNFHLQICALDPHGLDYCHFGVCAEILNSRKLYYRHQQQRPSSSISSASPPPYRRSFGSLCR